MLFVFLVFVLMVFGIKWGQHAALVTIGYVKCIFYTYAACTPSCN